jgi:hypothetical protein
MTSYDSIYALTCTFIDNPVTINGNPNFADVLEFSNKSSIIHYRFLYRLTKEENGIKNKDLFKMVDFYNIKKYIQKVLRVFDSSIDFSFNDTLIDIKNLKKVGVMTLKDSWLDEKSCTLKRIGSFCKKEEKAVFDTIPSELANKGCEAIYYNVYDLFYTCDYNDSGSITTNTKTSISNLFSKFLSWFIAAVAIIFALIIPGIGYYIKRKQFDPSSSSFDSFPSSLKTELTIS